MFCSTQSITFYEKHFSGQSRFLSDRLSNSTVHLVWHNKKQNLRSKTVSYLYRPQHSVVIVIFDSNCIFLMPWFILTYGCCWVCLTLFVGFQLFIVQFLFLIRISENQMDLVSTNGTVIYQLKIIYWPCYLPGAVNFWGAVFRTRKGDSTIAFLFCLSYILTERNCSNVCQFNQVIFS